MLEDALGAEHGSVVFTIELNLFGGVDLAVSNGITWLVGGLICLALRVIVLDAHWEGGEHLVIDWKVFGSLMVRDLTVGAFNHLVLVELPCAIEAKGVTARKRDRLLIVMVIWLETNATFKNLIHLLPRAVVLV